MITEKIIFLVNRDVEAQGEIIQSFKEGQVYDLPAASARRWIKRNCAEPYVGKKKSIDTEHEPKPAKRGRKPKLDAAKETNLTGYEMPQKVDREKASESETGEDVD